MAEVIEGLTDMIVARPVVCIVRWPAREGVDRNSGFLIKHTSSPGRQQALIVSGPLAPVIQEKEAVASLF
jgi:hypothetical protein